MSQQVMSGKRPSLPFIHMLMFICAVLVSTSFLVGAAIADHMDPAVLTLLRFILASLLLFPYVKKHHCVSPSGGLVLRCCLISGFLVIFFWCMFLSLRYTSALNTSVLFTLVPAISAVYALFLLGERFRKTQLLALTCGMLGAIWVIFRGDFGLLLAMELNRGDLIFLGGCLGMGLYTPLVKMLHRGEPMVVMTFWVLVTGSGWLLVLAGYRLFQVDWAGIPLFVWGSIVYLAFFCTVVTFFFTQYSIPYIGSTRVMSYSYLYPSLVLLLDVCLGHGWPGIKTLPGVLVVLLAMLVLQKSRRDDFLDL